MADRQYCRNELIVSLLARCPVDEDGLARRYLMERRGDGVPIILDESRDRSGRYPDYTMIDDSELRLVIWAAETRPGGERARRPHNVPGSLPAPMCLRPAPEPRELGEPNRTGVLGRCDPGGGPYITMRIVEQLHQHVGRGVRVPSDSHSNIPVFVGGQIREQGDRRIRIAGDLRSHLPGVVTSQNHQHAWRSVPVCRNSGTNALV